jgi:hypothetical protein
VQGKAFVENELHLATNGARQGDENPDSSNAFHFLFFDSIANLKAKAITLFDWS